MKKTTLITAFIFAIFWLSVKAESLPVQNIRGTVLDKTTQLPLPGATVLLMNTNPIIGTTTNENGQFRLTDIGVGRHSLRISYVGYKEAFVNNILLNVGKEVVIEVQLEESVMLQDEVVVTASANKSEPINNMAVVSARGFTVEETSRYAGSRNDVARMASNYAGVVGSNDARNDIIIRGNSPMGLLWQLEGVPIPNPNHYGSSTATGGPVSILNNNVLMNSDFITAAFPASYGNALSGVFDLKMRSGNDEKHEFLGQVGFNGFEAGAEGPLNKKTGASYLTNFRYSTLELMDKLGADLGTGTGVPKYKDFTVKVNLPRTKIGSISFFVVGGISDIEIWDSRRDTTDEKLDFYGGDGYDLTNGSDMITGGINHFKSWSANTYSRFSVSGSFHRFRTIIDSLQPVSLVKTGVYTNDLQQSSLQYKLSLHHRFNSKNNFNTGLLIRQTYFDLQEAIYFRADMGLRTTSDYNGSSTLYQFYGEWKHRFTDNLYLNSGLHLMHYALNGTSSLEPRLAMGWSPRERHSFGLGYGLHGMLNPISVYFRQTQMNDGTFRLLNKDLPYARAHHFVLSYDYKITEFVRLKSELYYQHIFDAAVDGGEPNEFSLLNQGANFGFPTPDTLIASGKGQNAGIELTMEHFLNKGFYYLLTASYYDSRYYGSNKVWHNTAFNGKYVTNLLLGKEWNIGRSEGSKSKYTLAVDLKTTFAGGQRYTPSSAIPDPEQPGQFKLVYDDKKAFSGQYKDYSRTDMKLAFRINGKRVTQEWAIDVQNLFGQENVYSEGFNKTTGEKYFTYQMGQLIIPQYRIIF